MSFLLVFSRLLGVPCAKVILRMLLIGSLASRLPALSSSCKSAPANTHLPMMATSCAMLLPEFWVMTICVATAGIVAKKIIQAKRIFFILLCLFFFLIFANSAAKVI